MMIVSLWWVLLASLPLAPPPVDFDTQIVPLLTRYGCNQGSCHGAAIGRGGFRLSLYGGDPAFDYESITWELAGRRIHRVDPERSLLYRKPTEDLEHGGGFLIDVDSEAAELLRRWISEGAQRIERRRLLQVDFTPTQVILPKTESAIALRATARFSDGTHEDVTRWTTWTTADSSAVTLDLDSHHATVLRPGRHLLLARYLNVVTPIEVIVPFAKFDEDVAKEPPAVPSRHPVDRFVEARLRQLGLRSLESVDDLGFLRRIHLDLAGRLPSPEVIAQFEQTRGEDKRQQWIDRLLASDEFTKYWTYRLAAWWRVRAPGRGKTRDVAAAEAFQRWIEEGIRNRTGLDELARQLVTAEGDSHRNGAATFYRLASGPRTQAEYFSETLMGVRLRCANCHNHPLDQWTQDDYHGLAALFAGIERQRIVRDTGRGEVIHPRTSLPASPRIPGVDAPVRGGREQLAQWLTSPDNPYFARAIVNRTWAALMGRGLVEPVDDLGRSNPATHPRLLAWLTEQFQAHQYDLRWLIRTIVTSRTYQRRAGSGAGGAELAFLASARARPLTAEVLADAIADVTGVSWGFEGYESGTRAIELFDVELPSRPLDIFGRCDRSTSCEAAAPKVSGLAKTLHLLNGDTLNKVVSDPENFLQQQLAQGSADRELLEACYLRALTRRPTPRETAFWLKTLARDKHASAEAHRRAWEDFLWALLCCREFTTNH